MYVEKIEETQSGTMLTIDFGKNGKGLSNELIAIGEKINVLSKTNDVYLSNTFVDLADDVYQFEFKLIQKDPATEKIEKGIRCFNSHPTPARINEGLSHRNIDADSVISITDNGESVTVWYIE
jgi:hypothetical protein